MKNTIKSILAAMLAVSMTGCTGLPELPGTENTQSSSDTENKKESLYELIDALDCKDREKFKSVFSENALARDYDMDSAIDYIFDLYKGEYTETLRRNQSGQTINGQKAAYIEPYAVIKTTESCYILTWKQWTRNEMDPSYVGIYSLVIRECEEDHYDVEYGPTTTGLLYPENEFLEDISLELINGTWDNDVSALKKVFSDELYSNTEKSGTMVSFVERFDFDSNTILSAWIKNDIYFIKLRGYDVYICVKLDTSADTAKVTSIRVLDVNEYTDEEVENYDFSNDKNEIYM